MTGPEHYGEAERLIERVNGMDPHEAVESVHIATEIALAQAHAMLALAAATALAGLSQIRVYDADDWQAACSVQLRTPGGEG